MRVKLRQILHSILALCVFQTGIALPLARAQSPAEGAEQRVRREKLAQLFLDLGWDDGRHLREYRAAILSEISTMERDELAFILNAPHSFDSLDSIAGMGFRAVLATLLPQIRKDIEKEITDPSVPFSHDIAERLSRGSRWGSLSGASSAAVRYQSDKFGKKMIEFLAKNEIDISPESFKIFFRELTLGYLKNLDAETRKNILNRVVRLPPGASELEYFTVFVRESGPYYQKIVQMIARDKGITPSLAAILKTVESSGVPIRDMEIQLRIARDRRLPAPVYIPGREPLGIGTIAQTNIGLMEDREVAVRTPKGDIEPKLRAEERILRKLAPDIEGDSRLKGSIFERFGELLSRMKDSISGELNPRKFAEAQRTAAFVYADLPADALDRYGTWQYARFSIPKIMYVGPDDSGILIMELARGVSAEKYFENDPALKKEVAEDLANLWLREALFGSGFFHADLHPGNVLFARDDDGKTRVTLLDYGMHGTLSLERRRGLLQVSMALESGSAPKTIAALENLGIRPPRLDRFQMQETVKECIRRKQGLPHLLEALVSKGEETEQVLVDFNRGLWAIEKWLEDSGSEKTVSDLAREMGRYFIERDIRARFNPIARGIGGNRSPFTRRQLIEIMSLHCRGLFGKMLGPKHRS